MKFCRACGTGLAGAQPATPAHAPYPPPPAAAAPSPFSNMPPPGPLSTLVPNPALAPPPPTLPPTLPPGSAAAIGLPHTAPTMMAPVPANVAAVSAAPSPPAAPHNPLAAVTPVPLPYGQDVPPTLLPGSPGAAQVAAAARTHMPPGSIACPRCSAPTPIGFVYCQACGLHIQAVAPTDPGGNARPRSGSQPIPAAAPSSPGVRPGASPPPPLAAIDPQAATMAPNPHAATPQVRPPTAQPQPQPGGVQWGTAVLVNRDGTDGERFKLDAEYTVIGRAGADIAFDEDRFLARLHARLERGGDGVVSVSPTDTLNGVFRKTDTPVELTDGMVVLVGREVLRYERVDLEERAVTPLIRHGVALFGSPPREPWGRLLQILPSGGHRDIRHLVGEEVVLGREEGDIVFRDDAFMSRRHAAINWDGKRAQLTDLGSSNGTFVRLAGTTPVKHGDHLRLGDQLLRIELGR